MMSILLFTALILALLTPAVAQVTFDKGDSCRCQASWETFYSRRRGLVASQEKADEHKQDALTRQLQYFNYSSIAFGKNLFMVEDIYVLPPEAPPCRRSSSISSHNNNKRNLRQRRVQSNNRKSSRFQYTRPLQVNTPECTTAPNGVPLCCFSDSASPCNCDCPAIPETFDCPVTATETLPTAAPTMQIITGEPPSVPTSDDDDDDDDDSSSATTPSPSTNVITETPTSNMVTQQPTFNIITATPTTAPFTRTPTISPSPSTTVLTDIPTSNSVTQQPTFNMITGTPSVATPSMQPNGGSPSSFPTLVAASASPSTQPNGGSPSTSPNASPSAIPASTESPTWNIITMQPTSNMNTAVPTVAPIVAPTRVEQTRAPHVRRPLLNPRPTQAPTMSSNIITDNIPVVDANDPRMTRAPVVRRSIPGVYTGGGFYYKYHN